MTLRFLFFFFFFFNDTATTEIYTLSLHDALPISKYLHLGDTLQVQIIPFLASVFSIFLLRSEEHTSELQSQSNLVCRLLLEKKKTQYSRSRSAHRSLLTCDASPSY